MKNQQINISFIILTFIVFLLSAVEAKGQEVLYNNNQLPNEDVLKSSYIFDTGLKKIRMPVNRNIDNSSLTKSETIKSSESWDIQRVHSGKLFSEMSDRSLALDANGKPHIAYGQAHLYYAWYDEEWHIETVDDSWDVGRFASLALDSDGYPHISYYDRDHNGDLKYANKDENGWHITTVDDDGTVGLYTSIALDANNHPHICYYDQTNGNLKYALWDGSQWHIEAIDSGRNVGFFNSLALDQNGAPHISYFDYTNGHLKYAKHSGGSWRIQVIDNGQNVGLFTSIALDNNDHPHISYFDYANGNLKYAVWIGGQWEIITVDNGSIVGVFSSLAIDADGNPHIGYGDYYNENLKYALYAGDEWKIQRLTPDAQRGRDIEGLFISLTLDANDHPHISHLGQGTLLGARVGLRYTYYDGSEWQRNVVDHELDFKKTSLAVDNSNNPHIGYIRSDHAMGYATRDGNQWSFESFLPEVGMVNSFGGSERFLTLNSKNQPHLIKQITKPIFSFGDSPYPSFIYSWYEDNIWHSDTVLIDSRGWRSYVWTSSLVLDQFNMPHICLHLDYGGPTITSSQFRYLYRDGNQWHISTIDGALPVGFVHNSLAIDSEGNPHISYRKSGLRYARLVNNEWDLQIVDADGSGDYNSLKLDASNFPHISYYNVTDKTLQFTYWTGIEWNIETVDNNGDVGKYSSLDLDTDGFPHISYYDETNGNLKYAYWDGSQWQIETLDSYGSVGLYTSLALDANGNPHISYYDASFVTLKYATNKEKTETYSIICTSINESYGAVTGGGQYAQEEEVTLTATPATGYHFVHWTEDGEVASDNPEYTFTAEEDRNLVAHFAINTYLITATAGGNGSISPEGDTEVEHGNELVINIVPDQGYRIDFVKIDGTEIDLASDENWDAENGQYTFSEVTEAHTIEVSFEVATVLTEAETRHQLTVYPNPAKDELWVEFYHHGDAVVDIVLLNAKGHEVQQVSVSASGPVRQRMTTHDLTPGVYLLTIRAEAAYPVKKVVIEN